MNVRFLILIPILFLVGCFSDDPDWRTYKSDEFGISIESPYLIEFKTKDSVDCNNANVRNLDGVMKQPTFSVFHEMIELALNHKRRPGPELFSAYVHSIKQLDKSSKDYDSNTTIDNYLKLFKKLNENKTYKNFKIQNTPITCSELPAALLSRSFDYYDGNKLLFSSYESVIVIPHKKQHWTVHFNYDYSNKDDYSDLDQVTKRMIQSIKIEKN